MNRKIFGWALPGRGDAEEQRSTAQRKRHRVALGAVVATAVLAVSVLAVSAATGTSEAEELEYAGRSVDVRTIAYFEVPEPALTKLLPQGWLLDPLTSGPAARANVRAVFIDTMMSVNADDDPSQLAQRRPAVIFQIPVRKATEDVKAYMQFAGLSPDGPGSYGVNTLASPHVERTIRHEGETSVVQESWDLQAPGERALLKLEYARAPYSVEETEFRVYSQVKPEFFRVYRVEQAVDVVRSAGDTERLLKYTFEASGEKLTPLFNGKENLISIMSVPVYSRQIFLPQPQP